MEGESVSILIKRNGHQSKRAACTTGPKLITASLEVEDELWPQTGRIGRMSASVLQATQKASEYGASVHVKTELPLKCLFPPRCASLLRHLIRATERSACMLSLSSVVSLALLSNTGWVNTTTGCPRWVCRSADWTNTTVVQAAMFSQQKVFQPV